MIPAGTSTKNLKQAPFSGITCANCQSENNIISVSASYLHIIWIPLFPYRKTMGIVCSNCKHVVRIYETSEEVREMAKQLKATVKPPWYLFLGSIILTLIIGLLVVQSISRKNIYSSYLENPQVSDIYALRNAYETPENKYELWKVINVKEDSIDMSVSIFKYRYIPNQLKPEDLFFDNYITYHKNTMLEFLKNGTIAKVSRGMTIAKGNSTESIPDSTNIDPDYSK